MRNVTHPVVLALALVALAVPSIHAHELTFEERVEAQAAIERVYASHREGTTRSFEQAVPQSVLREKVRTYLKQTVALEQYWNTSVTAEMLDRELERMIRQTLMPERLEEFFAALGNDPLLVRECLARPVLVNRLTRNFFTNDERIHGRIAEDEQRLDRLAEMRTGVTKHPLAPEKFADSPSEATTITWDDWWQRNTDAFDEAGVKTVARNAPLPRISQAGAGQTEGACAAPDTWDNGSLSDAVDARRGYTAVWTGTEMIVWGGIGGGYNSGDRYDPATVTWTQMSSVGAPLGRNLHIAVWTGSRMIVWGGTDGSAVNTGGQYDPATDTWTPVSLTNAPSARFDHTAVWTGSQMLVWGGKVFLNDFLGNGGRYDPASDSWTSLSTLNAPPPLADHTAVWTGTMMLIWSRESVVGGLYAPSADAWVNTITDVNAPPPGGEHSAVWTGSHMLVWGGFGALGRLDSGGLYDPATRQWTSTSQINTPRGRSNHTAVWTGNEMIVWGGEFTGNTGGRYDPATDSWTPTSTGNGPAPNSERTSVWTGNRMITWGGHGSTSGEIYDPALDVWTPMSLANQPFARRGHIAVWTGDEMLISGGEHPMEPGGRYDPATDSWTVMSNVGAPLSAEGLVGVWTGSDLIVWGGLGASVTNVGGRYDPATDSWTTISLVDVPEPRFYGTAVWTGNEMIVWGGYGGPGMETDGAGGRYNPMTDTWQPTSLVGEPSVRGGHSAVWTGSRMIVWGGAGGGSTRFDTGGVYDPVTDSWTPTSFVNAPSSRYWHTAVWTGHRMIVWGGSPYSIDGGRYDPVTDSWEPTTLVDAPAPRVTHTAIWTGTHMLIWGGGRSTGGRYALGDAIDDDGDGLSECAGDCNDGNANVFPGAAELCDGLDNDCGGVVDELDFDLDGHGACAADCNDADAGVFAFPPEIVNLTFTDEVTLTWDSAAAAAGSATVHDIVVGLLSEGPVGTGVSETCLTAPAGANTATHLAVPDPGECYRYVIRGRNSCGAGTYGAESNGSPRSSTVCP